ncbi:MAG TPA: hypothetical protein VGF99_02935, partial [Myxococcota bacterium]
SPRLSQLIERMLDKRPAARPTGREVVAALAAQIIDTAEAEKKAKDRSGRVIAPHVGTQTTKPPLGGPTAELSPSDVVTERPAVMVRGVSQAAVTIALSVNGFDIVEGPVDDDGPGRGVEVMLTASPAQVARRVGRGATVVAAADPDDLDRVAALVHAGAAEVVGMPVAVEDLSARVVRAFRRASRQQQREKQRDKPRA